MTEHFIPMVLNGDAGSRPGMVGTFFKRVAKHFANEVAVVTPNGRLLSHSPAEGLATWQKIPKAERTTLEDLGKYDATLDPGPPAGGLILNVYARGLMRDPAGRLQAYKTDVARNREPGRDHLWLTKAEWQALVPSRPIQGAVVAVPAPVVERLCRYCLIDLVRVGGNGGPRRSAEVRSDPWQLTVAEVTPAAVQLRLDGSARLVTHDRGSGARDQEGKADTYQLLGFLCYDRKQGVFTRVDVVALSETGHYDEMHRKVVPLGVAFELAQGQAPAERVPPASFGKDYFGKSR
jgi:hypothetical protein